MSKESELPQIDNQNASAFSVLLLISMPEAVERIASAFAVDGFSVQRSADIAEAHRILQDQDFDFIICEHIEQGANGLDFLRSLKDNDIRSNVIILADSNSSDAACEALRLGAADYLPFSTSTGDLLFTVRKTRERERFRLENESLRSQVARRYSFSNIIAKSPAMLEIYETIKKIADYKTTILIYGESGTGKELVARAVHHNSIRRHKRFVAINCGAIPENLLESELFGHKRGSFTDALRDKKGLFEEAEGGTILLDEIGELPLHLQVKILRVLQENEIRPVGDTRIVPINVRVIAATLRDLETDVLEGRFRDDLFYRLNVITLRIPPLRERKEDIPLLVNHFIKRNQERLGLPVYGIAKEAMAALLEHDWPGNIRELENSVERAMILTEGEEITLSSLPKNVRREQSGSLKNISFPDDELSIKTLSRRLEETLIRRALEKTRGNRTHAAKLLEISHRTLLYKLKEYCITDDVALEENNNSLARE